ncbi:MAG: alpha/beta fold hydrolase [Rhodobacterales bacterium]|nr:alpha/beta fold hydrolase [Rhodobacterales bacterium]
MTEAPLRLGFLMFPGFPMACLTQAGATARVTFATAADELHTALETLDIRRPVVVGHSLGGALAQVYAARYDVAGVVLVDGLTSGVVDPVVQRLGGYQSLGPLARAGLMEGRACSVHWCYEAAFKADFPQIEAREVTILREGRRITASGAGAVFDLMLRLIEERLGRDCMTEVACWFQHPFVRDADASQKVPIARSGATTDSLPAAIRNAIRLFETHVEDPLRIPDVALAVGLSGRHFERMFKRETGQSPLRYYHHLRLMKARQRVLYSSDSLREIAASVGYMTSSPMSRHYTEIFGVSPRDERRLTQGLRAGPMPAEAVE